MNITIVGPGAIGSLWACKLHQAGHNVSLCSRSTNKHLSIKLDNHPEISFHNNDAQRLQQTDVLLITVKSWQVESALLPLLDKIDSKAILLFMHNGMGAVDALHSQISHFPIVLATTTHGALKPSAQCVLHTGNGQTQIGAYNDLGQQCSFLADVFNHALPSAVWNSDINTALWNKLAINCAINPLTALHQCKNGALAQPQFQIEIQEVVTELVQVMKANHIQADEKSLLTTIYNVINATAENYSSMHQDIHHKRNSEIDFITGFLIKAAAKYHIELPKNRALYESIKQIENNWQSGE
ncbi:2-dehydropantoate 2-reductase [Vibrio cortegadensis]|uniref:2-dehydropantoate 2-reductase n=1 Tax=Vibrio cortegadensis TaxID=1328770 RepID=UPI00352ED43A